MNPIQLIKLRSLLNKLNNSNPQQALSPVRLYSDLRGAGLLEDMPAEVFLSEYERVKHMGEVNALNLVQTLFDSSVGAADLVAARDLMADTVQSFGVDLGPLVEEATSTDDKKGDSPIGVPSLLA